MEDALALTVNEGLVTGEVALEIGPGTPASAISAALDAALAGPLATAAEELGAVLAAAPHRYARALPGKDEAGRTRYMVRARREGDMVVPAVREQGLGHRAIRLA